MIQPDNTKTQPTLLLQRVCARARARVCVCPPRARAHARCQSKLDSTLIHPDHTGHRLLSATVRRYILTTLRQSIQSIPYFCSTLTHPDDTKTAYLAAVAGRKFLTTLRHGLPCCCCQRRDPDDSAHTETHWSICRVFQLHQTHPGSRCCC